MIHNFQQAVDHNRNKTLLTINPKKAAQLEYRYTDTGETIVVPNIWYNQTNDMLADAFLFQAEQFIEKAKVLSTTPPENVDRTNITETIDEYYGQAKVYRQNARFLQMGCFLNVLNENENFTY